MPRNAFRCIDECTKWAYSPFKYCLALDLYSKHDTTCKLQSKTYNRGQVYSGQAYGVQVDSVQVDSVQVDSVQVDSVQVDSVQVDSVQVDSVQVPTGLLIVLGLPGVRTICAARK
ncbi:hypothetical protein E4U25_007835 [Claviceps purpurea]|nr:hypothetical protein E4U25_007835 [Claviceps purpurea]